MKFRIDYILSDGPGILLVRQMDDGNFALPIEPKFGGIPIRRTLDQPRSVKADGTLDQSVWCFTLVNALDASRFEVGQIAKLEG